LIEEGLGCDLLLLTGGVSMGKYDLVEQVLSELKAEVLFYRCRNSAWKAGGVLVRVARAPSPALTAELLWARGRGRPRHTRNILRVAGESGFHHGDLRIVRSTDDRSAGGI